MLAEGAKFLLISLDVDFNKLFTLDSKEDIRNFHYFHLINPSHPDFTKLSFQFHTQQCGRRKECRYQLKSEQDIGFFYAKRIRDYLSNCKIIVVIFRYHFYLAS